MSRFINKGKHEIGIAPDELIFRGAQKMDEILLRIIDFDPVNLTEKKVNDIKELPDLINAKTVTWLNIDGLHDMKLMEEIVSTFEFDQLVIAEVLNTDARPKIIDYENCTLITIKMLREDESGRIKIENLSLILTKSVLITFQEGKGDVFEPVRDRIRNQKKESEMEDGLPCLCTFRHCR